MRETILAMINVVNRAIKLEIWYHIMKIKRWTKLSKEYENENILSVFLCIDKNKELDIYK